MHRFQFASEVLESKDERLQAALAAAHAGKFRPLCLCRPTGIPMYVARLGDRYLIKRLPFTASHHQPECDSFEPPPELSGLGEMSGSAIHEDVESGLTTLKLDFALSRQGGHQPPVPSTSDDAPVRADGSKLTLRATLHFLWEQAELHRWSPGMEGKRTWHVVKSRLDAVARIVYVRHESLAARLFIPEPFSLEREAQILSRRRERLRGLTPGQGRRELMMVLAEVKAIEASRYGHKLILKHLPSMPFMVADDLHRRLLRRHETELALWRANESAHLLLLGTFGLDAGGYACIEEACASVTTSNWIPVDNRWDFDLVDALTRARRRFVKGLRYNLGPERPLASAVLTDTPEPTALYVVPAAGLPEQRAALEDLIESSTLAAWRWEVDQESLPPLPQRLNSAPALSGVSR